MFIKPDGTFTQSNIYVSEGEEICIVVLVSTRIWLSCCNTLPEEDEGNRENKVYSGL
jgi:hypothetical protein